MLNEFTLNRCNQDFVSDYRTEVISGCTPLNSHICLILQSCRCYLDRVRLRIWCDSSDWRPALRESKSIFGFQTELVVGALFNVAIRCCVLEWNVGVGRPKQIVPLSTRGAFIPLHVVRCYRTASRVVSIECVPLDHNLVLVSLTVPARHSHPSGFSQYLCTIYAEIREVAPSVLVAGTDFGINKLRVIQRIQCAELTNRYGTHPVAYSLKISTIAT